MAGVVRVVAAGVDRVVVAGSGTITHSQDSCQVSLSFVWKVGLK